MMPRRSRTLLAVLALASLVLLTLDYRQGDRGVISALQRAATGIMAPIQEGLTGIMRPVGNFMEAVTELGNLRQENAELEAELQRLREAKISYADLQRENAELRDLLAMRERLGYTTTGAQVIAQPPNAFEWSVLIDAGADQGIEPGMAVINAQGLVGKVVEVTRRNARVQLLSSPNAGYAVRISGTGEEGLLTGRGPRPFQLEVLNPEADIQSGAQVVTRVFQGTTVPGGIPIGEVEEARRNGSRFSSVRPYVDFTRLSTVQVILDAPVAPSQLPPEELVPDPDPPQPPTPTPRAEEPPPPPDGSSPSSPTPSAEDDE
jgi:rod shape-determining protein MreC